MKLGKHGCFIAGLTNFIGDTQSGMGGILLYRSGCIRV